MVSSRSSKRLTNSYTMLYYRFLKFVSLKFACNVLRGDKQCVLIWTVLITIFLVCNESKTSNKQPEEVRYASHGDSLITAGFLRYADSLDVDTLASQIRQSFRIYDERNNKIVHVDAEELAEFQFSFFLPRLNKMLNRRNFYLELKTEDNHENSYEVFLNGEKIQLYTEEELQKHDFWDIASRTFFKKLNELLKRENIDESFFLLYGGNDVHALLLTEKQFNIIADRYKNDSVEVPYRP